MFSKDGKNQIISTVCVNLICMAYGCSIGWSSASIPFLKSDQSTLKSGPLTLDEASWITSLLCIGGFCGNFSYGLIANRFGRKMPMLTLSIPNIVSWLLIIFGPSPIYLYISRFLAGFSAGGVFIFVPLYIAEIAEDSIRGFLGSLLVLICNVGILLGFILGNYFSYIMASWIMLAIPIGFIISLCFLPDTPQSLVKVGDDKKAEKSLGFYRNCRQRTTLEEYQLLKLEMAKLRNTFRPEKDYEKPDKIKLSDFTHRAAVKAMLIGIALMFLNQCCGVFAMLNYTASIFAEAGSSISPNMSAIIIGFIQLLGTYVSSNLVEKAGRKLLIGLSATGIGLGQLVMAIYTLCSSLGYDMESVRWIPIATFSFTIFIASMGVLNLPFLVVAEVLPEKIRGVGTSICMSILWLLAFLVVKYFPILSEIYGIHSSFFVFSTFAFAGATFTFLVIPETKGKSYDEILCILGK